ncbi:universal stress protein [Rhodobacter veldkampii DSM 11550]|uniref:Universal stress protein n=1 Tax=Phaeovulum veldkampii DSM 11550 TaxID=1185920 RepID=A0A2T4JK54_9RHOB|nr:universal stress protein [Phaeovulum veldkampii]MBK5946072.1 universal stress protein [Phaeovulum veldkampii DSM 11550]PTE18243.1 universal stress protein [Phaeovulum veldkampii DSM 11550]TDQ63528.1 universal stress protein family protein [Phaeovulum veldkampii DSM 11550]
MSYKSILTIVTDPAASEVQLETAIAMARREDAHLDVLCLGVDRTQTGYYYAGASAYVHQETIERAQAEAAAAELQVRNLLDAQDIRWAVEGVVAQMGAISTIVGLRARFADLVVQARPYGKSRTQDAETVVEAAMFDGHAPVLIVPDQDSPLPAPRRVIVAWNQSTEALTAIRRALPILKAADLVDITIIDPPAHGPERSDPGGQLSQMLARHGVHAEVSVLAKTMPRVSDVINRHVRDTSANMVVMGAYGHSRFREAILGGATRYMLEMAEVPVFMAH